MLEQFSLIMKHFYLFCFFACVASASFAQQDSIRKTSFSQRIVKVPVSSRLDTNEVIYDESGRALHYYQYEKLLNSSQYTFALDGPPGTPGIKKHLQKLTVQNQNRMYSRIKNLMEIKSPLLKKGAVLDISPLSGVFPGADGREGLGHDLLEHGLSALHGKLC